MRVPVFEISKPVRMAKPGQRGMAGASTWIVPLCVLCVHLMGIHASSAQSISAYLSADSVKVGDRFYLTLVATHGSQSTPVFPEVESGEEIFGDLEVIGVYESGSVIPENESAGARIDSLVYEVTTFALDTAYVPSIPVYFIANGDTSFYASRPLELPVVSLVTEDAQNIRDLAPIVDFPRNVWPWIIGLLLLSALAAGLIYYLSRRAPVQEEVVVRAPAPVIPPYEEAVGRLKRLEKKANLEDRYQVKPFYVELTETLRVYLGRTFQIGAMESTSAELMRDINRLAHTTDLPDESAYLLRRIFHVSDLVKFADMYPRPEVGHQVLVESRKLLDIVESSVRTESASAEHEAPQAVAVNGADKRMENVHDE